MNDFTLPSHLRFFPAVFAIKDTYQIFVMLDRRATATLGVGDSVYYDDSNGILRSLPPIHRFEVPMGELDTCGAYTLSAREILDRTNPHRPLTQPLPDVTFEFRGVTDKDTVNIYHLADVHNFKEQAVLAASYFGACLDALILNGDITNHSGSIENFDTVYHIISELTRGAVPTVFSRGNHDTRGECAELFGEYTPTHNGRTYYTFRLGSIWGMVLDCGEDKNDDHVEYGGTVCFHEFRKRETQFIKDVIRHADDEYLAEDVKYRLIISHVPFTHVLHAPFDIEQNTYAEWARLLGEQIHPDLTLHGHLHKYGVWHKDCKYDHLGQPCTAVVGSMLRRNPDKTCFYAGCALSVDTKQKSTHVVINTFEGEILHEEIF